MKKNCLIFFWSVLNFSVLNFLLNAPGHGKHLKLINIITVSKYKNQMCENSSMRKLFWMYSCPGEIQLLYAINKVKYNKRRKKKVDDISPKGYLKQTDSRTTLMRLLVCSEWITYRQLLVPKKNILFSYKNKGGGKRKWTF